MPPQAFLSYARTDDEAHPGGVITRLKIALEKEVRVQGGGKNFTIFQDKDGILAGEHWPSSLEEALQSVRVIIPVLSPSYFDSSPCAWELGKFQQLETSAGRSDLIIPIYFIATSYLEDEEQRRINPIASLLVERQRFDWRELRFEPFDSPTVTKELAKLAQAVVRTLTRRGVVGLIQERDHLRHELSLRDAELSNLRSQLDEHKKTITKREMDDVASKQERDQARHELSRLRAELVEAKRRRDAATEIIQNFRKEIDTITKERDRLQSRLSLQTAEKISLQATPRSDNAGVGNTRSLLPNDIEFKNDVGNISGEKANHIKKMTLQAAEKSKYAKFDIAVGIIFSPFILIWAIISSKPKLTAVAILLGGAYLSFKYNLISNFGLGQSPSSVTASVDQNAIIKDPPATVSGQSCPGTEKVIVSTYAPVYANAEANEAMKILRVAGRVCVIDTVGNFLKIKVYGKDGFVSHLFTE